ncbi:MAG: type II secretion system protein, partial [Spartobacteria bacterium]
MHRAPRAFTLLEMLAAVSIVLILVATIYPALEKLTPRAEMVVCMGNLRSLHTAFSAYATEGWPQIPKGIALGSNEEQRWWLEFTKKNLGLPEKTWRCPTITRRFKSTTEAERPIIHYLPTPFSAHPNKANKNAQMPWFIEIGNAHGSGNLLVRQNGTVEPAPRGAHTNARRL